MLNIQNTVSDQCIINIIDRRFNIRRIHSLFVIKSLCIDDILYQDTGDLLFQDIIGGFLQILVNGQVNIIPRYRIYPGVLVNIQDLAQTIYQDIFRAVLSLKLRFHDLFDPGFSYNGVCRIIISFFFQSFQFFCGSLSCIADQIRKIFCVIINTDGIFCNVYSLKSIF